MAYQFRQPFGRHGQQSQYSPQTQLPHSQPRMQPPQQTRQPTPVQRSPVPPAPWTGQTASTAPTAQMADWNPQPAPWTQWGQSTGGQPSAIPIQASSSGYPVQAGWPQGSYGQQFQSGAMAQSTQPMGQSMQQFDPQAQAGGMLSPQAEWSGRQPVFGSPAVDVVNKPDEIVLFANLPGFEKDDIQIRGDGRHLTIFAEQMADPGDDGGFFQRERPTSLQRTIQLPVFTDIGNATAMFEKGICKITLPKTEDAKEKEVGFQ